jgi:hypothetical protein
MEDQDVVYVDSKVIYLDAERRQWVDLYRQFQPGIRRLMRYRTAASADSGYFRAWKIAYGAWHWFSADTEGEPNPGRLAFCLGLCTEALSAVDEPAHRARPLLAALLFCEWQCRAHSARRHALEAVIAAATADRQSAFYRGRSSTRHFCAQTGTRRSIV